MSKVNREHYFVVQGWMVTDLGLKGNELMVYAIIYGFSQAEDHKFSGSLQYLADWTNSTKRGVQKTLNTLVDKRLIAKEDVFLNGVKFCNYKCVSKFHGMEQSSIGGMELSSTNNIEEHNLGIKKETIKERDFERFWKAYPRKVDKKKAKAAFMKADVDIETLISAVEKAKQSHDWQKDKGQFIPHPTTYLHGERWNDELTTNNKPTRSEEDERFLASVFGDVL